jgi:hypothetical protein
MPEATSTLPAGTEAGIAAPAASQAEHMIPLSRLNEEIEKRKAAELKATTLETESAARLEEQLKEQGKYKEIAEQRAQKLAELEPKANQVNSMESTLKSVLAAQIESLPEDKRVLVPEELTTQQKLNWLAKNAAILKAPAAFDIGAGKHGGSGEESVELTQEEIQSAKQFGMDPKEYAKFRDK